MFKKINLLPLILFGLFVAVLLRIPNDPDMWWHLRVGKDILHGHASFLDQYSWSMTGYPWVDHEWLTNIIMYVVQHYSGYFGLGLVFAALGLMVFGFTAKTGNLMARHLGLLETFSRQQLRLLTLIWTLIAAVICTPIIGTRPQVITLLGFAVCNYLLWQFFLGSRKQLWILPPLMLVWANLHGGFVIELGMFMLALLYLAVNLIRPGQDPFHPQDKAETLRQIKHLALVALISVAATLLNPNTYQIYTEAFRTSFDQFARGHINEWLSVNFQTMSGLLMGGFVLISLWLLVWLKKPLSLFHVFFLPLFLYLGFSSIRHTPLLVLFLLPWLMTAVYAMTPQVHLFLRTADKFFKPNWHLLASTLFNLLIVLGCLALAGNQIWQFTDQTLHEQSLARQADYPVDAVNYLQAHPPAQNLFNEYGWGGYLTWYLPQTKVYIDGRMASWQTAARHILAEYYDINWLSAKWTGILAQNHISTLLVKKNSILDSGLRQNTQYRIVYQDSVAVIFEQQAVPAITARPLGE